MTTFLIVAGFLALALAGVLKSNEWKINVSYTLAKDELEGADSWPITDDMTGKDFAQGRIPINTTAVDAQGTNIAVLSSVGTPGWAIFRNHDQNNTITVGGRVAGTYLPTIYVKPRTQIIVPLALAANNIYASAAGTASDLQYRIYEL